MRRNELDAQVAEIVMGESLTPPRERALMLVGVNVTSVTGNPWTVRVDDFETMIHVPRGEDIPGHPSDMNFNARYFRYVAQKLIEGPDQIGQRVAKMVEEVRETPKPYSTDIAVAWTVVEKMTERLTSADRDGNSAPWPSCNYLALQQRGGYPGKHGGWAATFTCLGDDDDWYEQPEAIGGALGNTAAEAICRAALAALSAEAATGNATT
jgi:hypothetical protein